MAESVKGMLVKLGLDTTELRQGLAETQNELKKEQSILSSVNKQMRFNTNPLDAWKKKSEQLNKVIGKMNDQITDQNKVIEKTKTAVEKGLIDEKKLDKENTKLEKMKLSLQDLNAELDFSKKQTVKVFTENITGAFSKLGSVVTGVLASITGIVTGIMGIANSVSKAINDINENATEAGLGVEAYQRLTYASKQLYVSESSVSTALTKVNGILGDLATGDGLKSAQVLTQIGLSYEDIAKMGTEDAFYAIIDALKKMGDQTKAVAYANELFGNNLGTKLLPLIKEGSSSIKEMGQDANVLTQEQTALANQYDTTMADIKSEFIAIGADVLPMVNDVLKNDILPLIQSDIAPLVKDIIKGMTNFIEDGGLESLIDDLKNIFGVFGDIAKVFGKIKEGYDAVQNSWFGKASDFIFQNPIQTIASWFGGGEKANTSAYENSNTPVTNATTNKYANKTYNVTINTTASSMSLDDIDSSLGLSM